MQAHKRIQTVFIHHHHIHPAQQFTQHDAFIHALAAIQTVAQISQVIPVQKGRALIVTPEF